MLKQKSKILTTWFNHFPIISKSMRIVYLQYQFFILHIYWWKDVLIHSGLLIAALKKVYDIYVKALKCSLGDSCMHEASEH